VCAVEKSAVGGGFGLGDGFGLSTGLAYLGADGQTPEDLLAVADRRMYLSKAERKLSPLPVPKNGTSVTAIALEIAEPENWIDLEATTIEVP
jgi:hypothetical protein